MGFMETSLMRQLGKLVEVVRHANEILGDGYRLPLDLIKQLLNWLLTMTGIVTK